MSDRETRNVVQQSCPHGRYEPHVQEGYIHDVCTATTVRVVEVNLDAPDYAAAWDLLDGIMDRRGYANPWGRGALEFEAIIDEAAGANHDLDHAWRYVKNHDRCDGCSLTRDNTDNVRQMPSDE